MSYQTFGQIYSSFILTTFYILQLLLSTFQLCLFWTFIKQLHEVHHEMLFEEGTICIKHFMQLFLQLIH